VDRPSPALNAERRRAPRTRARLDTAYEDRERQVFLRTADVSEEGVFLLAADPPPLGAPAKLCIEVPGHPALVRVSGVVARRQLDEPRGFAVAFDGGAGGQEARAALRHFVARAAGER
jgi:hypothetical protein